MKRPTLANSYIILQGQRPIDSAETWTEAEAKAMAIKRAAPDRPVFVQVDGHVSEIKL